jgi:hypothetical protein
MTNATGWWEAGMLVDIDKLPVGAKWRGPRGGDVHKKLSPYSHINQKTGEVILDRRLYGSSGSFFVEEVQA